MAITNPIGDAFRVALAFQGVKGTPAVPAGATRVPAIAADRGVDLEVVDPQGLAPGPGVADTRLFPSALEPRGTLILLGEPVSLAILLESATAGAPIVAAGTTTFVFQNRWTRFLTLWVDDGFRARRIADVVVTRLRVETAGDVEGAIVTVELAGLQHDIIATVLGAAKSALAEQWAHVDHVATVNAIVQSPRRTAFELEVEHELWGGFWSGVSPGLPEEVIRHRALLRIEGELPPSDEAAARPAAAIAGSTQAAEWSWTRANDILRVVAPRVETAQSNLFGLAGGEVENQTVLEELRAGAADADIPATITLES